MRYVTVPTPVTPKNIDGTPVQETYDFDEEGKPLKRPIGEISLFNYLQRYVFNARNTEEQAKKDGPLKIGKGYEVGKRCMKLDRLFSNAKPGDIVQVEEKDWEVVESIIKQQDWASGVYASQLFLLEEAWVKASDTAPKNEPHFIGGEPERNSLPAASA